MTRIGNTAEYGTSGLDEKQAAGLLSAVGEAGLLLVESGPTTDPVAAGLNTAIDRARRAWERTQPQLVIDGWLDMLDELDETGRCSRGSIAASAPGLVEPVCKAAPPIPAGGLNNGAEPCCGTPEGLTAVVPAAAAHAHGQTEPAWNRANGADACVSAPSQHDGPGRDLFGESHGRGQIGA